MVFRFPEYKDKLEFTFVEDISKLDAFEGKLDGLDGVFHVASPFFFKVHFPSSSFYLLLILMNRLLPPTK